MLRAEILHTIYTFVRISPRYPDRAYARDSPSICLMPVVMEGRMEERREGREGLASSASR